VAGRVEDLRNPSLVYETLPEAELPRAFSGWPPYDALEYHRIRPYRRTYAITRRRPLTIETVGPSAGQALRPAHVSVWTGLRD
jgi:hypothetical protein